MIGTACLRSAAASRTWVACAGSWLCVCSAPGSSPSAAWSKASSHPARYTLSLCRSHTSVFFADQNVFKPYLLITFHSVLNALITHFNTRNSFIGFI